MHGLSFSIYEVCKRLSGANAPGHHVLATSLSGVIATLSHDACITPIDTIKQRLQFGGKPYKGVFDCAKQIFRREGIGAFYRGYTTTLSMNLPYASVYYGAYESMKKLIKKAMGKKDHHHDAMSHLLAGAVGGCLVPALSIVLSFFKSWLNLTWIILSGRRGYHSFGCVKNEVAGGAGCRGYLPGVGQHLGEDKAGGGMGRLHEGHASEDALPFLIGGDLLDDLRVRKVFLGGTSWWKAEEIRRIRTITKNKKEIRKTTWCWRLFIYFRLV